MTPHGSIRDGQEIILFSQIIQTCSGAHPAFYLMGTGALSPVIKWPEREADLCPLSSAKVKNEWKLYSCSFHITSWHGQGRIFFVYISTESLYYALFV
jgi:hypothetical protein